jgi:hypothetical protein
VTVTELAGRLDGTLIAAAGDAGREVRGGYVSDLLSDVIAHACEGDAWVTLQRHVNVVAVAHLRGLAAVVLVAGRQPEPEAVARATDERVPIVCTRLSAFDAAGVMYALGLRGSGTP